MLSLKINVIKLLGCLLSAWFLPSPTVGRTMNATPSESQLKTEMICEKITLNFNITYTVYW